MDQNIWFILFLVLLLIEALTQGLTTIWFAFGALLAMLFAYLGLGLLWQLVIFWAVSLITLFSLRKYALTKMKKKVEKTNVDALIGRHGKVTSKITSLDPGEVFVYGNTWTAISKDRQEIDEGQEVKILAIDGIKLVVEPVQNS